jgi:ssDNA-binding Zn-finger/Zn-ribbon topoisomerase 1
LKVQGEFTLNPQTFRQLVDSSNCNYNLLKLSKPEHDYSLVLSKHAYSVIVACADYPKCSNTITVFGLRD